MSNQIARTFIKSKKYLQTSSLQSIGGIVPNICGAIHKAYLYGDIFYEEYCQCIDIIANRINSRGIYLSDWVVRNIPVINYDWLNSLKGRKQMQLYRHRWLDALIEEFSE